MAEKYQPNTPIVPRVNNHCCVAKEDHDNKLKCRNCKAMVCVCIMLTIVSFLSAAVCVYTLLEIRSLRAEPNAVARLPGDAATPRPGDEENHDLQSHDGEPVLHRVVRQTKKGKQKKCPKNRYRLCKVRRGKEKCRCKRCSKQCLKSCPGKQRGKQCPPECCAPQTVNEAPSLRGAPGPRGPPGPKGDRGEKGEKGDPAESKNTIAAAHYTADIWRDKTEEEFGEDICINVAEWGGKACRNRTLELAKTNFRFLEEAPWVQINQHIRNPASKSQDGRFIIQESGLYLLYSSVSSSVLFYDTKLKQSQAIVKNGKKLFKCMEGVDYIDKSQSRQFNSKYKTCSISGVTYLTKDDVITVQNLYSKTMIDLTPDSTFFGLVQLAPGS